MAIYYALDETSWKLLKHFVEVTAFTEPSIADQMRDIMEVSREVAL